MIEIPVELKYVQIRDRLINDINSAGISHILLESIISDIHNKVIALANKELTDMKDAYIKEMQKSIESNEKNTVEKEITDE